MGVESLVKEGKIKFNCGVCTVKDEKDSFHSFEDKSITWRDIYFWIASFMACEDSQGKLFGEHEATFFDSEGEIFIKAKIGGLKGMFEGRDCLDEEEEGSEYEDAEIILVW